LDDSPEKHEENRDAKNDRTVSILLAMSAIFSKVLRTFLFCARKVFRTLKNGGSFFDNVSDIQLGAFYICFLYVV
jgi:hypothetical protein